MFKQNILPIKSLVALFFVTASLMIVSIFAIIRFDSYAYETTTINVKDNWVKVFSDSNEKGASRSTKIENGSTLGFDCKIKHKLEHPYCLMQNWITSSEYKGVDLSIYKYMRIKGSFQSPTDNDFLRVSLRHFDLNYTQEFNEFIYKHNMFEIKSKDIKDEIVIDLNKLYVPHWWQSLMDNSLIDTFRDISNVPLIELSTGTNATDGLHSLRVDYFYFDKEIISIETIYGYILIVWSAYFLIVFLLLSFYLYLILREKTRDENNLIQINTALSMHSSQLEALNKTDLLTGLLNRSGMKTKMLEYSENPISSLIVAMLDLDHFKKINDQLGHQSGDLVLEKVGEILNAFTKGNESVSRFGGEEFLLLIPNQSINKVIERLETLRQKIESTQMGVDTTVTISIGVSSTNRKIDFKKLIKRADKALYKAKNNGRNCIKQEID